MSVEIRVPPLGESIVEATVSRWLKHVGDTIAPGEPLLEIETDKVNLELPSEQGGVLARITKAEGATVRIGDVLGIIEPSESASSKPAHPVPITEAAPAKVETTTVHATPVAIQMAAENQIDLQEVVGSGPGGRITKDDVLDYLLQEGVKRRQREASPPTSPTPAASVGMPAAAIPSPPRAPTPGSSVATVAVPSAMSTPPIPSMPQTPLSVGNSATTRREERVRMTRRRLTIAQRLLEAQHNAAILTTFNEIDMHAVMAIRNRHRERFKEQHGVSLGYMPFFVKATISALKAFPLLNAEIQGEEMVVKYYYDIGIAVGAEQGLVVPVIRDADRKNFAQIEQEIAELARRAHENTLTLADLQGGTFSITNGGVYGSLMSTPILNAPQVGILGMHKIEERPVVVQGQIVIRPMMYVALSYDHRIVDGRTAVRFLVRIKELLEDPEALLLG